ncbi:MAG: type II secretion system F family protein [Gammaproteobacteria bacterium]|nr:type II secretion system F family protein [Gammaproteobacteria bacterium]
MALNIFTELATLIEAGHSPAQALKVISRPDPAWQRALLGVEKGQRLSNALHSAKLINRFDREWLSAAETAGRTPQALTKMGKIIEQREANISRIKSRIMLPLMIFVVAIIVSLIISVVLAKSNWSTSLLLAITQVLVIVFCLRSLFNFIRKDAASHLDTLYFMHNSERYQDYFARTIMQGFAWLQASGVDSKSSFRQLASIFTKRPLQQELRKVAQHCGSGGALTDGLKNSHLPLPSSLLQALGAGEHSGAMTATLDHQLHLLEDRLAIAQEQMVEAIPRIIYVLAVVCATLVIF